MINFVILAGIVVELPVLHKKAGISFTSVLLEIERPSIHQDIQYDHISVTLMNAIAEKICSTCKIGEFLCIKGRIESTIVGKEGKTYCDYKIIGEHISLKN